MTPLVYEFPVLRLPLTSSTYFIYRTQLSIISHEIITELFCASTIKHKWGSVQETIRRIDQRLQTWKKNLPSEFDLDFDTTHEPDWTDPWLLQRTGLAMLYNSSRMILFRPCLCQFEGRIAKQSEESQDSTQKAVVECILSARRMISLFSWSATRVEKLFAISPWWNTFNYLCEALSILMLEMAFQSQHMPRESANILDDAKKGVNWLAMMSAQSISARKAWEIFDRLIRLVAPVIGSSAFDMPTEAPIPPGYNWRRHIAHFFGAQGLQPPPQRAPAGYSQLSENHLRQFQSSQPSLSLPTNTNLWTAQEPSFQPFFEGQSGYLEQFRNPLDQAEALNRFSGIGNVHGPYDDPWLHMFGGYGGGGMQFGAPEPEEEVEGFPQPFDPQYPQFGEM